MFGKRITLFRLLGFDVRIDLSWIIIAIIVTWSLAHNLFPSFYKGLSGRTYWAMGITGALGLFASIVFHEFFHSVVARHYGLPMKGITLFIFGGISEMADDPQAAKTEFMMAIAGPLSSFGLSVCFYGILAIGRGGFWPASVHGVISYLALINAMLGAFNLIPAFPLDGGRVLRSALWKWKDDLRWATRISSQIGGTFSYLMIAYGLMNLLLGNLIGGIWWFLIGIFLRNASLMSYQQLLIRQALEGEHVGDFMKRDIVTIPPFISVQQLVDDYVHKYNFKMYPVLSDGNLVGCVRLDRVKEIPREEWKDHAVAELINQCSTENTISPKADAMEALSTMRRTGNSRLMVVEAGKLLGVVTLKDLLEFLSRKIDLESPQSA